MCIQIEMIAILILGFLSISCAYLAKNQKFHVAFLFSFIFIAVFLAIRYDFGNDYMAYLKMHKEIQQDTILGSYYEIGWVVLNKIVTNFFFLIISLSVLNCLIYFRFINIYVPSEYWWLAVFIYVFNTNFMLIQSSTMRQTVAILIFIYSIRYIINRRFLPFIACCCLAFSFHSSALILFPVYWCTYIKLEHVFIKIFIVFLFVFIYIAGKYLISFAHEAIMLVFTGRYDHFLDEVSQGGFFNISVYTSLLILILIMDKKASYITKIFNKLSILALFSFPIATMVPMAARIGYYFFPATLITYTFIAKNFSSIQRSIFILLLISIIIVRFISVVFSDIWREHFINYKTIYNI